MGSAPRPLEVAIIGAGIAGLNLAIGLQARGISYHIYERALAFKEIGAGLGLSPNAERAMKALSPDIHAGFMRAANPNGEDYFQWVDGFKSDDVIYRLWVGEGGFPGCRRSDLLEELFKLVPDDRLHWGKHAEEVREGEGKDGAVVVRFKDGTSAEADVGESVSPIGCP